MSAILDNIQNDKTEYNKDIVADALKNLRIKQHAFDLVQEANTVWNGSNNNLAKIKKLVDDFDEDDITVEGDLVPVTKNINEMLEAVSITSKWKFNIKRWHILIGRIKWQQL